MEKRDALAFVGSDLAELESYLQDNSLASNLDWAVMIPHFPEPYDGQLIGSSVEAQHSACEKSLYATTGPEQSLKWLEHIPLRAWDSYLAKNVQSRLCDEEYQDLRPTNIVLTELFSKGKFYGNVFLGQLAGIKVAVEVIQEFENVQKFVVASQIARRLHHPNIARTYEIRRVGGNYIVVMEWIEGRVFSREACIEFDLMIQSLSTIAETVSYLMDHLVVHRDIKPENILLTGDDYRPVLVDFGLALDFRQNDRFIPQIAGTPLFMPPEAIDGVVSPAFDAYSLGVTAALLLGSKSIPCAKTIAELFAKKKSGEFNIVMRERVAGLNAYHTQWILDLLDAEPEKRLAALRRPILV